MVLFARGRAELWLWIFFSWSHVGIASLHSMMPTPAPIPQFTSHSGQVCSTWGNDHFKTFNGDLYYFPGTCNYLFASHCKSNNEDFNIQIRRSVENGVLVISHITATLLGVVVEIRNNSITLDGVAVTDIPAGKSRVHVDKLGNNMKITASTDISLIWNGKDSLLLKLNRNKYANKTCGLCGDFSGFPGFTLDGEHLTPVQYGNLQKRNGPTEECLDVHSTPVHCKDEAEICKSILTSAAFSSCNSILEPMDYIDSCVQDLCICNRENIMHCKCSVFAEYSRQCTHAGGVPGNWRTPEMCYQSCPFNMVYQECGSPCPNTCSNTERTMLCEDHGTNGCFCPPGTVLDDINNTGCIPQEQCSCVYNSEIYTPGSSFSTPCRECACSKGKWKCKELPCTGSCSVEGGSHITSFDGSRYSINGDCSYVLAKHNTANDFSVLAEMKRCGITNKKSCLKSVVLGLNKGETVLVIKDNGVLFLNWIPVQPPISVANMTIFWATSFFLNVHMAFDFVMQVQFVPVMQVYIILGPSYHSQTCGLCGNFNNIQRDDFKTISGVSEGTAASFANTWKSNSNCPNIKNSFEDPCSLNLEKEKYAQHWCGLLTLPDGPFSPCHSIENPLTYHMNCLLDTCSCKDSEECMCAALASYAYACAKKSVTLIGWRDNVCEKYTKSCKDSQVYQYNVTRCQPTCRSQSNDGTTFNFKFSPVDGCVCQEGTYLNDNGDCVTSSSCPCYYQGNAMESGEMVEENGVKCTCERGQLTCMGAKKAMIEAPECIAPLVHLNCSSAPKGTKGVECQKSCHTLDMDCFSSQCISGCVCPPGMVFDKEGGCISEQQCPCTHNEATYRPGDSISVGCNTCTCKNRRWQCTHKPCLGTCSVYGDGHYITFDNKQFTFSGSCEYILVQDNYGENRGHGSFKVIAENVPCGTTGTTCTKNIKFFLRGEELRLDNEKIDVVKRDEKDIIPYDVMRRGMYMIIKGGNGIYVMWDKMTTIHVKLAPEFQGKVSGICGNYDGNANNDFTTRSHSVVENLMEFCNSWKTDPSCPDVHVVQDPCSKNPYRKAWALKQCGIITSDVFRSCHAQVDPSRYYESCISDSCACDTGGDCECFCTTVALYAQACSENGICINWRTPTICPMFCDYYNDVGECEWHYKACGDKCMKTCRNPKGECLHELSGCEGCYPKCPPSRPFLNENTMKCVAHCGCYENGIYYNNGEKVPRNCSSCVCAIDQIKCHYDIKACQCTYDGKLYNYEDTIPNSKKEDSNCRKMKCDEGGVIVTINECRPTKPSDLNQFYTTEMTTINLTTESFTSIKKPPFQSTHPTSTNSPSIATSGKHMGTSTQSSTAETISLRTPTGYSRTTSTENTPSSNATTTTLYTSTTERCYWTEWIDVNHPTSDSNGGDKETIDIAKSHGIKVCTEKEVIKDIKCRATSYRQLDITELPQNIICNTEEGLICTNQHNAGPNNMCLNYEMKLYCCEGVSPTTTTRTPPSSRLTTTSSHTSNPTTTKATSLGTTPGHYSTTSTEPSPSSSKTTTLHPSTTSSNTLKPSIIETTSLATTTGHSRTTSTENTPSSNPTTTLYRSTTEKCYWTEWIDENHPTSDSNGGDKESFEIAKANRKNVCKEKKDIKTVECRVKAYPHIPFEKLSQNATCNVEKGLLCNNEDNTGTNNRCHNYEMRFFCCNGGLLITNTTMSTSIQLTTTSSITAKTSTTETTLLRTSTPNSQTTSTEPSPSSNPTTTLHPSTISSNTQKPSIIETTSLGTTTGHSKTTSTENTPSSNPTTTLYTSTTERCYWTEWIDVNHPTSDSNGGDKETIDIAKSHGIRVCTEKEFIKDIKCRATSYRQLDITELPQNIICNTEEGLICTNQHKAGPNNMCLNYEMKLYCCEGVSPTTTTRTPPSTRLTTTSSHTSNPTTTKATSLGTTPGHYSTTSTEPSPSSSKTTALHPSTTSSNTLKPSIIETTSLATTTGHSRTTSTENTPSSNPTTTLYTSTTKKCYWTEWIDVNHPTTDSNGGDKESFEIAKANRKNVCKEKKDIKTVECRVKAYPHIPFEKLSQNATCNVEKGLLCNNEDNTGTNNRCHNYEMRFFCCNGGLLITNTTMSTSIQQTTTSSITPKSSTTETTLLKTSTPNSQTTSTEPSPSSNPTTTLHPSTISSNTRKPSIIETTSLGTTTGHSKTTSTENTPSSNPTTTLYTSTTERCYWTEWIDVNHPTSDSNGGDKETIDIAKSHGIKVCTEKEVIKDIKCRATSYRQLDITELPQNIICNTEEGLICKNQHNAGPNNMCLNYEMKLYCCEGVSPTTTTRTPPSSRLTTTSSHTSNPTTTKATSLGTTTGHYSTTSTEPSPSSNPTTTLHPSTTSSNTPKPSIIETTSLATTTGHSRTTSTENTPSSNPTTTTLYTSTTERCYWTEWIDVNHPTSDSNGGDKETIDIAKSHGIKVCTEKEVIKDIKCRATSYRQLDITELPQNIICNTEEGLICKNQHNAGQNNMCLNYEMKLYCCEGVSPTTTTRTPPSSRLTTTSSHTSNPTTTKATSLGTTTGHYSTTSTEPSPSSNPTTALHPSTTSSNTPKPSIIETTSLATTTGHSRTTSTENTPSSNPTTTTLYTSSTERCYWTEWIDVNHPTSDSNGGDKETIDIAKSHGIKVCTEKEVIKDIKCRATSYRQLDITELPQNIICNTEEGLICKNQHNAGPNNMCLNYEMKLYCCEGVSPTTTTRTPPSSRLTTTSSHTSNPTTTKATSLGTTTGHYSTTSTKSSPSSNPTTALHPSTTSSNTPKPSIIETTSLATTTGHSRTTSTENTPSSNPTTTTLYTSTTERCYWTEWIDVNHPTSDSNGGDKETIDIAKSHGIKVCTEKEVIKDIKCRATSYRQLDITELPQNIICNTEEGLICKNQHNAGQNNMCLNYEMKLYCCEGVSPTTTTRTPPSSRLTTTSSHTSNPTTTKATSLGTTTGHYSTTSTESSPSSNPTTALHPSTTSSNTPKPSIIETTSLATTTGHSRTTSTENTPSSNPTTTTLYTSTTERCYWTEWIDVNHPTSDSNGGDKETIDIAKSHGIKVCTEKEFIKDIKCRATSYRQLDITELPQNIICNTEEGLICTNQHKAGPNNMCLNYEMKLYCCEGVSPTTTTRTPPSTRLTTTSSHTSNPTTTKATSLGTTPGHYSTTSTEPSSSSNPTTALHPSTTSSNTHKPSIIETTSLATTTGHSRTTSTENTPSSNPTTTTLYTSTTERCYWTEWIDVNHPTSDSNGGDKETIDIAKSHGIKVCTEKEVIKDIKCRATSYRQLDITELPQNIICNTEEGLICKNQHNAGQNNMCLNYEMKLYCCEGVSPTTTTRTPPSSRLTTTSSHTSNPTTTKATSLGTTTGHYSTTFTEPSPSSNPTTALHPSTTSSNTPKPSIIETTSLATTTGHSRTTSTENTPSSNPTTTTLYTSTTERCYWTEWIDVNHPTSDSNGGDKETIDIAKSHGIKVCTEKEVIKDIKCRATSYRQLDITELPQNIICNTEEGLICKNQHNAGQNNMCLNYEMKLYCCEGVSPTTTTRTPPSSRLTTTSSHTSNPTTTKATSLGTTTGHYSTTFTEPSPSSNPTTALHPSTTSSNTPKPSIIETTSLATTTGHSRTTSTENTPSSNPTTTTLYTSTTERCYWTEWIDVNHPTSDSNGGDKETIDIAKSHGIKVCTEKEVIKDIKCRATSYRQLDITELPQNIICNTEEGLICKNQHNAGQNNMCLNYEMKLYCCEGVSPTTTTRTPPSSRLTTTSSHTSNPTTTKGTSLGTTTGHYSTTSTESSPSSNPTTALHPSTTSSNTPKPSIIETTSLATTTGHSRTTSTENTPSSNPTTTTLYTSTTERCYWTEWIDVNHPTSDSNGGDKETIDIAKSHGIKVCTEKEFIKDIKCRATSYRQLDITELPQNIICNTEEGLICTNQHKAGPNNMCLNYEMKLYCCEGVSPTTTTRTPPSTRLTTTSSHTSNPTTTKATSLGTTPGHYSTTSTEPSSSSNPTTALHPSTTSSNTHKPSIIETTSLATTTGHSRTTSTENTPSSNPTTTTLYTSTTERCYWTEWIDVNHPTSDSNGGDKETIDIAKSHGIKVCTEKEVIKDIKCRATSYRQLDITELPQNIICNTEEGLICKNQHNAGQNNMCLNYEMKLYCCEGVSPTTTTRTPPSSRLTTTSSHTSNPTTTKATSLGTTTGHYSTTSTEPSPSSNPTTALHPSTTSSNTPKPSIIETTSLATTTGHSRTTSTENTPSSNPTTTTLYTSTTERCYWTEWIDVNHPTSDSNGGDKETIDIAKSHGIKVCTEKEFIKDIKCRATSYRQLDITELPQNIICNTEEGLICKNQHNAGQNNMCLNYEMKLYCCEGVSPTTTTRTPPSTRLTTTSSYTTSPSTIEKTSFSTIESSPLTHPKSKSTTRERPPFCVYEGSEYEVGTSVPKNPKSCEECKCTMENNSAKVTCKIKVCQTRCPLGFIYKAEPGQCCGKCVQNFCRLDVSEMIKGHSEGNLPKQCCQNCSQDVCAINNTVLIKPGNLWRPPGDNCTCYDCEPKKFTVIRREMSCPAQKPLKCAEGILVNFTSADGCCTIQSCEPRKCDVMKSWEVMKSEGCEANVTITNCGGYCTSISRHPSFPKMVEHNCTCCQPTKTTSSKVHLLCKNGRKISYSYTDVLQCACRGAACVFTE